MSLQEVILYSLQIMFGVMLLLVIGSYLSYKLFRNKTAAEINEPVQNYYKPLKTKSLIYNQIKRRNNLRKTDVEKIKNNKSTSKERFKVINDYYKAIRKNRKPNYKSAENTKKNIDLKKALLLSGFDKNRNLISSIDIATLNNVYFPSHYLN